MSAKKSTPIQLPEIKTKAPRKPKKVDEIVSATPSTIPQIIEPSKPILEKRTRRSSAQVKADDLAKMKASGVFAICPLCGVKLKYREPILPYGGRHYCISCKPALMQIVLKDKAAKGIR